MKSDNWVIVVILFAMACGSVGFWLGYGKGHADGMRLMYDVDKSFFDFQVKANQAMIDELNKEGRP